MDKQQIISFIKAQLDTGKISPGELTALARGASAEEVATGAAGAASKESSWSLNNILYIIGAIIGLVGISILVAQHWVEIGFVGRIGVTLGISFLAYIGGILLCKSPQQMIAQIMFVISGVLAPVGVFVLFKKLDISFLPLHQGVIALALFIIFAFAQYIARSTVLVLLLTAFATWLYYSLVLYVFSLTLYHGDFTKWASVVLGFSYILTAFGIWHDKERRAVDGHSTPAGILYGLGTLAVLGGGISIGGVWDFIFILFIFAAFYGGVYMKSRSMLFFGAVFLMAHVMKLTFRFFLNSLGWPVALIISGALIIAVGYLTFQLNQRYLSKK